MITADPQYQCYKCKEELVFDVKIGIRDTCPNCTSYLHSCRNCRFWNVSAHNQCLERSAELVRDREAMNRCDFFQFRVIGEDNSAETNAAKAKLDSLFGGGATAKPAISWGAPTSTANTEEAARARLEALFKK